MDRYPSISELRRMPTAELLTYAQNIGDDEAAWDELNERNADASYGEDYT